MESIGDPVAYYRGRFTGTGRNTDELRALESESERREETEKVRRVGQSAN